MDEQAIESGGGEGVYLGTYLLGLPVRLVGSPGVIVKQPWGFRRLAGKTDRQAGRLTDKNLGTLESIEYVLPYNSKI